LTPAKKQVSTKYVTSSRSITPPRGVPAGLLFHYILHRLATKSIHGYELLQDIERKTGGAWRPGPGSVYPMFKKLLAEGYVKVDKVMDGKRSRLLYSITPRGLRHLQETRHMFADGGQRWSAVRGLFIDMIETEYLGKFILDGVRGIFELVHEMVKSRGFEMKPNEIEYVLREYALHLEREAYWVKSTLEQI
jgi:DNA-binding PadR family transcriptional regulator